ncbi:hypothetical protein KKB10_06425 [Patescibacteria group bacterium]|nr:hypothetical protein [Patescibacteria group bacterium]MBU1074648.1 hypothetical protein [Patescibacteria group bacterium]MBU1952259.1 hypothetical protein [Patescibacteria group bacterium]
MPELPDLEIYKENLKPKILNKKITGASVHKSKVLKNTLPADFEREVIGKSVSNIQRRGKMLIFSLSSDKKLIAHLMLYGQMNWQRAEDEIDSETCIIIEFGKNQLRFVDSTGWMHISFDEKRLEKVGMEPLLAQFTIESFQEILKRKQLGDVKGRLTDQKLIAGIGNAYVDEILWEAKINPSRVASLLKEKEVEALFKSIQKVINESIREVRKRLKGEIFGEPREFLAVHRKKECPNCFAKIRRIELNKKGTYFCPRCQK